MDQSSLSEQLKFDSPLVDHGIEFWSIEAYYQAMKVSDDDLDLRRWIASLSPDKARQVGQRLDEMRRLESEERLIRRLMEAVDVRLDEMRRLASEEDELSRTDGAQLNNTI
jgi:predicted NAD-dependent protein-ADP-ribosyltransferase YbiA (DUF1768 family)